MNSVLQQVVLNVERFLEKAAIAIRGERTVDARSDVAAYHGFGTPASVALSGRVLGDPIVHDTADQSALQNLRNMLRRYDSNEISGAKVVLSGLGATCETTTDEEGYYHATLRPKSLVSDALWQPITASLPDIEGPAKSFRAMAQIPTKARFGLISDVDDTVVRTGAANLFSHARIVLMNSAYSRVPFAGVAPFYTALQNEDGVPANPIFYVSSSPWNLYSLFCDFLAVHQIPAGTFFLKDFGFDEDKFFKSGHGAYKSDRIKRVLKTYPDLNFILVGDSGQHDVEIYRDIVTAHPDRVLAVYIRDVTEAERDAAVHAIASAVTAETGVPFLLVGDTLEAARHAAESGWLDPAELAAIKAQVVADHTANGADEMLDDIPEQLEDLRKPA